MDKEKLMEWLKNNMTVSPIVHLLLVAIEKGKFDKEPCKCKDITHVIDAMRLVIEWKKLSDQCLTRDSCKKCPYYISLTCSKQSTEDIMNTVANVFDDFLQEREE